MDVYWLSSAYHTDNFHLFFSAWKYSVDIPKINIPGRIIINLYLTVLSSVSGVNGPRIAIIGFHCINLIACNEKSQDIKNTCRYRYINLTSLVIS